MYTKIYPQMFEGSLVKSGYKAVITFQQMLILADKIGVIDRTPEAISRITTIPLDIILEGIAALEEPDPESRSPDEEGRRIVRLSPNRTWGWRIVNYEHYRNLRKEEDRTEYHRQYWRNVRSPKLRAQKDSTSTQLDSSDSTDAVSIGRRRSIGSTHKEVKDPASRSRTKSRSRVSKSDLIRDLVAEWRHLGGLDQVYKIKIAMGDLLSTHRASAVRAGIRCFWRCVEDPTLQGFLDNGTYWITKGIQDGDEELETEYAETAQHGATA